MKRFCLPPFRALRPLLLLLAVAAPAHLFAEANYVYHERTTADPGCGGNYVTTLNPSSAQTYPLRFKVEYQFGTDNVRVYYTTNGAAPSGAFGVGNAGTFVLTASYACTFGGPVVDVASATIPALPAGTVVKYIVSAWHGGGGAEIFANGPGAPCGCGTPTSTAALATVFQYTVGSTTDLYWDSNGTTAGAGTTPTGTWGASNFWSTVFDGSAATAAWTSGRRAIFSAGGDATSAYTVTISPDQTASGMTIEEGTVTLATGAVIVGAGNVTVNSGATLSTDSSARVSATAGATMTVNGGTVRTTNPGAAGTFMDTDFVITLGAAGGTFSHTTANILNIVQTASKITGPGALTKTGAGVLAFAGTAGFNDYTGGTIVNDGELRIRTVVNTLPTATAVTVNSPGIFNLNAVNQQIGSLAGNGDVGLGSATLTVGDATSTLFVGAIKDIANAGAGPTATIGGKVSKLGVGTLTLGGVNTFTGGTTLGAGTLAASNNTALGTGLINVSGTAGVPRALAASGAARTITNAITLTSADGLIIGGSQDLTLSGLVQMGVTGTGGNRQLVVDNTGLTTLSGNLFEAGATPRVFTKTGTGILALVSSNTYSGGTIVSTGKLYANNLTGSATGPGTVLVTNAGTLGGTGLISGLVVIASTATLAPGNSVGTLTVGSSPTLGGTVAAEINKTGVTLTGDKLAVSGQPLAYAGTLTVTASGDTLTGGETFDLFDASSFSGAFTATNLPTLGVGLNWWLGGLTTDGSITVNRAPVANATNLFRLPGSSTKIRITNLLAVSTSDLDGNARTLQSLGTPTNGTATVSTDGTFIYYDNTNALNDTFTYTVNDGRGGVTTGTITVTVTSLSGTSVSVNTTNGTATAKFQGIVGYHYDIERSEDLMTWTTVASDVVAGPTGAFQVVDLSPPPVSAFYRSKQH